MSVAISNTKLENIILEEIERTLIKRTFFKDFDRVIEQILESSVPFPGQGLVGPRLTPAQALVNRMKGRANLARIARGGGRTASTAVANANRALQSAKLAQASGEMQKARAALQVAQAEANAARTSAQALLNPRNAPGGRTSLWRKMVNIAKRAFRAVGGGRKRMLAWIGQRFPALVTPITFPLWAKILIGVAAVGAAVWVWRKISRAKKHGLSKGTGANPDRYRIRTMAGHDRLFAKDWQYWNCEAQKNFCNKMKRKPHVEGKPVSSGPSCAEVAKMKCSVSPSPKPKPPKPGPRPRPTGCASCVRVWKTMKTNPDLGSNKKAAFRELQKYLAAAGYAKSMPRTFKKGPNKPDGLCGRETKNAIRRFQKDNGLKVDGCYGTQTHAKMQEVLKGKVGPKDDIKPTADVALHVKKPRGIFKAVKNPNTKQMHMAYVVDGKTIVDPVHIGHPMRPSGASHKRFLLVQNGEARAGTHA